MSNFQWGLIIGCKWVFHVRFRCIVDLGYINVEKDTSISDLMYCTFSDRCLWSSISGTEMWVSIPPKRMDINHWCMSSIKKLEKTFLDTIFVTKSKAVLCFVVVIVSSIRRSRVLIYSGCRWAKQAQLDVSPECCAGLWGKGLRR